MSGWPELKPDPHSTRRRRRPLVWLLAATVAGLIAARNGGAVWDGLWVAAAGVAILAVLGAEAGIRGWRTWRQKPANSTTLAMRTARLVPMVPVPDRVFAVAFRVAILLMMGGGCWTYLAALDAHQRFIQARFPSKRMVPIIAVGTVVESPCPLNPYGLDGGPEWPEQPRLRDVPPLLDDNEEYSVSTVPFVARSVFVLEVVEYRGGLEPFDLKAHGGAERVRVFADERWPDLRHGVSYELPLIIDTPEPPGNPAEFDYRGFLRETGISRVGQWRLHHGARPLAEPTTWEMISLRTFAAEVRQRLIRHVHAHLSEPHASLLLTLTVAARSGLDDSLREQFRQTGTVHLLVVSGLHIGFLAILLEAGLSACGVRFRTRAVVLIVLLIFFREMAGGQVAVTRAVTMACFYFGARLFLRPTDFLNLFAGAALVTLLVNPHDLFRTGFHLSFGAVFWLRYLGLPRRLPPSETALVHTPFRHALRWLARSAWRSVWASTAAFLGLSPLIALYFNMVSPAVIVTNLAAVPVMFGILAAGTPLILGIVLETLLGVEGLLREPLAALAHVAAAGQTALIGIVGTVAEWPFSHVYLATPHVAWVVVANVILGAFAFRHALRLPIRRAVFATALVMLAAMISSRQGFAPQEPTVTFLDVNRASCAVIETPNRFVVLVDPGTDGGWSVGRQIIAPFIFSRGIREIEAVILTHPTWNHCQGLHDLLDMMPVRRIIVSPEFAADPAGIGYLERPTEMGVPILVLDVGDVVVIDGTEFCVFAPLAGIGDTAVAARKDRSMVVGWRAHPTRPGTSLLVTGGIGLVGTDAFLHTWRQLRSPASSASTVMATPSADLSPVTAVIVPAAGRTHVLSAEFFDTLRPQVALFGDRLPPSSALRDAMSGHTPIYDTFSHGAIQLTFAADGTTRLTTFYAPDHPHRFAPR